MNFIQKIQTFYYLYIGDTVKYRARTAEAATRQPLCRTAAQV